MMHLEMPGAQDGDNVAIGEFEFDFMSNQLVILVGFFFTML